MDSAKLSISLIFFAWAHLDSKFSCATVPVGVWPGGYGKHSIGIDALAPPVDVLGFDVFLLFAGIVDIVLLRILLFTGVFYGDVALSVLLHHCRSGALSKFGQFSTRGLASITLWLPSIAAQSNENTTRICSRHRASSCCMIALLNGVRSLQPNNIYWIPLQRTVSTADSATLRMAA
ncbi:hypothetical protein BC939DRAFT_467649 [Gamsiella multidivaricata]|uniref:uncharacterized protein n=1 Tax=Gamsiella multidivaricata TaxID=101098 RepID=UPI00221EA432|nr:uncharacterized protein BC939DRAFT_467649 [Gamsiella multidivaricata]KAI7816889.1 hypothetical protein BC939DRAFT_467649 [Gamsiella multidivaricata]